MSKEAGAAVCTLLICALASCTPQASLPDNPPEGYARDCGHFVFYEEDEDGSPTGALSVVGEFNDWTPDLIPLLDPNNDGLYVTRIELPQGEHLYGIANGDEITLDRFNPLTGYDQEGEERSLAQVGDCHRPKLALESLEASPSTGLEVRFKFLRAANSARVDPNSVVATLSTGHKIEVEVTPEPGDIVLRASGLPPGKHWLGVNAADTASMGAEAIKSPVWVEDEPFEWRDALIYQIVVDRFRKGGGELAGDRGISRYHDGDLHGVVEAIEGGYFDALGINALWLSPLYDNPDDIHTGRDGHLSQAYHGYWPASPRSAEPRFGGDVAVDRLVEAAHARGMRVIMDVVLNHVHESHPYASRWAGERFNNPDGECLCGLTCSWAAHIEDCWFDPFLPDLNLKDEVVLEQMVDDALWWVERFDLDGLRVDAVPMMPRSTIRRLRHRLAQRYKGGPTHHYLLGETFTGRGDQGIIRYYLGEHSLSGQFDFPVMWALRAALAGRTGFVALDTEVLASEAAWRGSGAVMAPILGNHDVPRFISDINGDEVYQPRVHTPLPPARRRPYELMKLAWSFLLTQPGAPIIYYGDELGLPGANDPDNRRDMRWGDDVSEAGVEILEHVQRLGRARRCYGALRRGDRQTLFVHDDLYIFGRDAQDGRPALILLNRSEEAIVDLELDIPETWSLDPASRLADLFGTPVSQTGRKLVLSLGARSAAVLLAGCVE